MMPQVNREHKRGRKQERQQQVANGAESRAPSKKKRFMFVKLKGLGCKGAPMTAPAIIRSAAEWEAKGARNQKKRKPLHNRRSLENVVVDVPDVCCTPPGIGIASDVAPRARNHAPHRKVCWIVIFYCDHDAEKYVFLLFQHSREARRNDDDAAAEFPAVLSGGIGSRTSHRSAEEIIEVCSVMVLINTGRILVYPLTLIMNIADADDPTSSAAGKNTPAT